MSFKIGDDIIDTRDIMERIEELEGEHSDLVSALEEAQEAYHNFEPSDKPEETDFLEIQEELLEARDDALTALNEWNSSEDGKELHDLQALSEDVEAYAGDSMKDGLTLILDSYFVEYCQDMVQDIGDLPKNIPAYLVIDWDATAENLKADYTETEIDGNTYLFR